MREIIMGYQGEMSLKGLNRNQFESAMMKILRYRLKTVGKFKVYCTQSTFYMEPEEEDVDMDLAFDRVRTVFGLAALSRAVVCEKDFDTICRTAEEYLGDSLHGIKTFKVEARRSDKTYPMTSPELMRELGAYLLGLHNYLRVDVKNPQFKVIVEIRDYGAYIHGPKIPGEGGLPVGTSGRALNMLSGGIDSPVAAYRMAKRGLALDHIHFASPPYTSERAKLKVKALAQKITPYTGSSNLFVVPYTKPQEYIRDNAPDVLFTVLMRRSMMRIANRIATRQGCEALITGENPDFSACDTTAATPETPWMSRELAIGDATVRIAVASGLENTSKLLDALESGEAAFDFVEIMACPGGCVGGGGQPIRFNSELAQTRAGVLNRLDAADKLRYSHENPDIAKLYADWIGEPLSHTAHEWLHTDQESWKI